MAALTFAFDTLKTGGHFVCKYYQGAEDKVLETKLKKLFEKVHRDKPDASRKASNQIIDTEYPSNDRIRNLRRASSWVYDEKN
jgi:23S rRNA U2552 (ribose-2'-O)-methylase RlmE/FtsJ